MKYLRSTAAHLLGGIAALALFGMASEVGAAPITFTYRADNAQGDVNNVGYGPGSTVVITLTGDTAAAAACNIRGVGASCIPATGGTVKIDANPAVAITGLNNTNICATATGSWVGVSNSLDVNLYSVGNISVASGNNANLNVSSGPFAYAANSIHTHPSADVNTPLFSVAAGTFEMWRPEVNNTAASNVQWVVGPAAPTLTEWGTIVFAICIGGTAMFGLRRRRSLPA